MTEREYTIGIDLGQSFDYTAFAVLGETQPGQYDLLHVERHREVPYPTLVERARKLVSHLNGDVTLAVDATGVGRPVVDMLEEAEMDADLYAITLMGCESVQREDRRIRVPKRDVVSTVACLLQTGSLRIPRALKGGDILEKELLNFRAKITLGGHDTYGNWREKDHDDLVLAVGLACWLAENGRPGWGRYAQELREQRLREGW
jgi:hypothetical protein